MTTLYYTCRECGGNSDLDANQEAIAQCRHCGDFEVLEPFQVKEKPNGTSQDVSIRLPESQDAKDDLSQLVAHKILVALEPIKKRMEILKHDDDNAEAAIADLSRQVEALKKFILYSQRQRLLYQAFLKA